MTPEYARTLGQPGSDGHRRITLRFGDPDELATSLRECGCTDVKVFEEYERLPEVWWRPPAEETRDV